MKKKISLIIVILIMSIGFASISTTLLIKGGTKINENKEDFEIIFTGASLDNVDVYNDVVSQDKKTITFTSNELKKKGDTSILNYEIINNSRNYDAEVKINCNVKDETTAEYTSMANTLEDNKTVVKAKESVNGTLTITLDKTSTENITEEYTCTLEFNALERDTLGYDGPYEWTFSYSGNEQEFVVPVSGTYKIETWGAEGSSVNEQYSGGYGGYSTGEIELIKNNTLYINVGGMGQKYTYYKNTESTAVGGYNGGGYGHVNKCNWDYRYLYSGGGATHVATETGLLSEFEDKIEKILIVSGGGGSGSAQKITSVNYYSYTSGGSGGGYIGNPLILHSRNWTCGIETNTSFYSTGGSQTDSGVSYFCGQPLTSLGDDYGGKAVFGRGSTLIEMLTSGAATWGGGGGFYGGSLGAGGSGYIGNDSLIDKIMYCYNCSESEEESTKTVSTTCVSETPTSNCSKIGNGYARITLIT